MDRINEILTRVGLEPLWLDETEELPCEFSRSAWSILKDQDKIRKWTEYFNSIGGYRIVCTVRHQPSDNEDDLHSYLVGLGLMRH